MAVSTSTVVENSTKDPEIKCSKQPLALDERNWLNFDNEMASSSNTMLEYLTCDLEGFNMATSTGKEKLTKCSIIRLPQLVTQW
jgi:hypothetical protein